MRRRYREGENLNGRSHTRLSRNHNRNFRASIGCCFTQRKRRASEKQSKSETLRYSATSARKDLREIVRSSTSGNPEPGARNAKTCRAGVPPRRDESGRHTPNANSGRLTVDGRLLTAAEGSDYEPLFGSARRIEIGRRRSRA